MLLFLRLKKIIIHWRFACWLAAFLPALAAMAHDPFSSVANAQLDATGITVEITMGCSTLSAAFPDLPPVIDEDTFTGAAAHLKEHGREFYRITAGGLRLPPGDVQVSLTMDNDVLFRLHYPPPQMGPMNFHAIYLEKMPASHIATLYVEDGAGKSLGWDYLDATKPALSLPLPVQTLPHGGGVPSPRMESSRGEGTPPPPLAPSTGAFIKLGMEHILTGYDHLLFLGGLLVACRRFRTMAGIITCFTLAHSLTLALAALDLVVIPSRIVEPLIAASIVFVGVENLLRRGEEPKGRWALTFGFGLVHGFGFAGALKAIGLGAGGSSLLAPLFSFNLGVELGQIAVAAVTLPLLLRLRAVPAFVRYGLPAASTIVTLLGSYWFLQRTVLA